MESHLLCWDSSFSNQLPPYKREVGSHVPPAVPVVQVPGNSHQVIVLGACSEQLPASLDGAIDTAAQSSAP